MKKCEQAIQSDSLTDSLTHSPERVSTVEAGGRAFVFRVLFVADRAGEELIHVVSQRSRVEILAILLTVDC